MGTRVFVGGLTPRIREDDLERFFDGYGRLRDIVIKGRFGFVEFDDVRDAEDAVKDLDGKTCQGERLGVEFARRPGSGGGAGGGGGGGSRSSRAGYRRSPPRFGRGPPVRTNYRVIVENLSSSVSWQDLKDFMRKAGDVTFSDAHNVRTGEGLVEYQTREDMERALDDLDGLELNGKRIKLYKDDRSKGDSRSRSRSRSPRRRSRSRSRSGSRGGRGGRHDRSPSRSRSKSP